MNNPPYVGSGPFTCVEWKKNNYVHLVANPTWWGPKPKITDIYFTYYTNADTMLQDIKAGTVDAAQNLVPAQVKQLQSDPRRRGPRHRHGRLRPAGVQLLHGAQQGQPGAQGREVPAGAELRHRQAEDGRHRHAGLHDPGTTIIPPNYYHDPDWHWEPPAGEAYTFDPAKAKQLLDAAGYKDTDGDGIREYKGKPIDLRLITRDESTQEQQEGKFIAGWFRDVGVKVTLSVMDSSTLSSTILNEEKGVLTPDYDMFLWGWYLDYDPGSMLSYFTKAQIGNWSDCFWTDAEYEKLFKQQSIELDPNKRKVMIDRMQQILYEQSPYIVTDYQPDFEAYNTAKWKGYIHIPSPNGNTIDPAVRQRRVRELPHHRAEHGHDDRGERRRQRRVDRRRRRRGRRDHRRRPPAPAAPDATSRRSDDDRPEGRERTSRGRAARERPPAPIAFAACSTSRRASSSSSTPSNGSCTRRRWAT